MIVDKTMETNNGHKTSHLLSHTCQRHLQHLKAVHVICESLLHFSFFIISAASRDGDFLGIVKGA